MENADRLPEVLSDYLALCLHLGDRTPEQPIGTAQQLQGSGHTTEFYALRAAYRDAAFGASLGRPVDHVAYRSGTSGTVTSRFYGLGPRGSALASLVFTFMTIGLLSLENAVLYYGALFVFGLEPSARIPSSATACSPSPGSSSHFRAEGRATALDDPACRLSSSLSS